MKIRATALQGGHTCLKMARACDVHHSELAVQPLLVGYRTNGRTIMKTIASAIIALSVLAGVTSSASAYEYRNWADQAFSTGQGR